MTPSPPAANLTAAMALAALEVVRTLNDLQIATDAPIEVVFWTNEEGSRFVPV